MGMYDELECKYPLPFPEVQGETFQTKDFDCAADAYLIDTDGRLYLMNDGYRVVPEEQRPYYGKPEWENPKSLFRLMGSMEKVPCKKDVNFHGDLHFYTSLRYSEVKSASVDFVARFTDGVVTSIRHEVEEHEPGPLMIGNVRVMTPEAAMEEREKSAGGR